MKKKTMLLAAALTMLAVPLAGCSDNNTSTVVESAPTTVTQSEGTEQVVVIDVRTPEEYGAGHLQGASNVDIGNPNFEEAIQAYPKDAEISVYCRSGNRSSQAIEIMKSLGFTNLTDLGGLENATRISGLDIVQ